MPTGQKGRSWCSIEGCEHLNLARNLCGGHYSNWRLTGDPISAKSKCWITQLNLKTGCHEWQGSLDKDGYARKSAKGKTYRLARIVLAKKLGRLIHPGLMALHSCGNRACLNEKHIYEGDNSRNMKDRTEMGNHPVGDRASQSKLSSEQVLEIKRAIKSGARVYGLPEKYKISVSQLYRIKNGENWAHLKS